LYRSQSSFNEGTSEVHLQKTRAFKIYHSSEHRMSFRYRCQGLDVKHSPFRSARYYCGPCTARPFLSSQYRKISHTASNNSVPRIMDCEDQPMASPGWEVEICWFTLASLYLLIWEAASPGSRPRIRRSLFLLYCRSAIHRGRNSFVAL
jgi:hypothetical protein